MSYYFFNHVGKERVGTVFLTVNRQLMMPLDRGWKTPEVCLCADSLILTDTQTGGKMELGKLLPASKVVPSEFEHTDNRKG